ncbi:MAG: cytosylglucuronate decarboxylase [Vicinamibacterales bacterium]
MATSRTRYLFIRILEACNADCFMCRFALSQDRYRFTLEEFEGLLPDARTLGVGIVRFTGGEPLLHADVVALVRAGTDAGMKMSVITNGALLPAMIRALSQAGLAQVIVSVDGASAETHDYYRNTPGLFDKCAAGLALARDHGVLTRVNTVVGPHNYEEMPRLQRRLTDLGVSQWELSAIKLEGPIAYRDPEHVRAVCEAMYDGGPRAALIPMGKRFYGDTEEERRLFFESGVTPRPGPPACHLVGDVIYLDAKGGRGFGCSLLPHRSADESGGGVLMRTDRRWTLDGADFDEHVRVFRAAGPTVCRGCSTTAAGYSDDVARSRLVAAWHF